MDMLTVETMLGAGHDPTNFITANPEIVDLISYRHFLLPTGLTARLFRRAERSVCKRLLAAIALGAGTVMMHRAAVHHNSCT
jgi:hypothetical protein